MNKTLPERIFICGFMGAGKSTVGMALAQRLEQPFHDLDQFIEQQAEKSIAAIFETEGEEGFRKKEQSALLQVIRSKKGVIALGGGTLQNQHLVDHVKVNGLLVLVDTPMEEMLNRIMDNQERPLLLDDDGNMKSRSVLRNELQQLYDQRYPYYEQSEVTITTADYSSLDAVINQLVKKIKYHVALH